ncbi:MAG: PDZ domain-containing protein [Hamadaea sp.]|uniref:M50 family metallopeptidase n=1 Tax=Hamadaea sp. TaxID=2024425 RepID=UPI00182022DF|nr:site-2 protease family protein [Hamadaea sp.]NUR71617.1 PDZ domain-containing protein [Hamadaea sp.]NUT20181.1 PDZ domain-containing protein [Hamadaea sp.]
MMLILGIALGALAILVSVSLHEAGHMLTAKMFGMKVTRYFIGFGPTLWSFKKGETEYGIKGIPLGGFVKITGMTPQEEDADDPRAMWRYPVWKRTIVMVAGSVVHFILAFLIFWFVAANFALANPDNPGPNVADQTASPAYLTVAPCVQKDLNTPCTTTDGPAKAAGLQDGDLVTQVGTTTITKYGDLVTAIRALAPGTPTQFTYVRDGQTHTTTVTPAEAQRPPIDDDNGEVKKVAAIGVGVGYDPSKPKTVEYNAIEALPVAGDQMKAAATGVVTSIKNLPNKIPGLIDAIGGGQRDADSPVSVVGASRLTGEAIERGFWEIALLIIAGLNFFVGVFNLLPLLPLDGGHIAIAWFERARSWLYARLGKRDPGRVDYYKLMPLTYAVILVFGAFTLLTVTADVVNPITIFK